MFVPHLCNCHPSPDPVFAVSAVKEVKPVDWEHPRIIGMVYEYSQGLTEVSVEFDTIEAARDWRNELRGVKSFSPLFQSSNG